MDSSPCSDASGSQPTQLLQHALARQTQERGRDGGPDSPNDGNIVANDFSLDSRIIPIQPATPRYHLQDSILHSPEDVLTEEKRHEKAQAEIPCPLPAVFDSMAPGQGSGSAFLTQHGDNPVSASAGKAITTHSFHSPPTTPPPSSMPVGNRHYPRSPSFPSQDSFAGPVSQDPAEQYLASTKQFDVPLSELGETPTQEVIHSPTDPALTLPDASEHKEFIEAAMREYDAQRANRVTYPRANILVAATPSDSGPSGTSQHRDDAFSFHNCGTDYTGRAPRFDFGVSSSFDKMLDQDLTDPPDPTPGSARSEMIEPTQADGPADFESPTGDVLATPPQSNQQTSPPFEWITLAPSTAVASSNPRSLLRMVHPSNRYRIAKMRNLAGDVEPPSFVTMGTATQPSGSEETQFCHANEPAKPNTSSPTLPVPHQKKIAGYHLSGHQPQKGNEDNELEDPLDIVPDSEPLRAGPTIQTPSHPRAAVQSPLKKRFRAVSPISEHGPGDCAPDSLEVEESEADVPLAIETTSKNTKRLAPPVGDFAAHGRKTRTVSSAPEKDPLPVLEKLPRNPTSSLAKGTEPPSVPTSLPEQDLQDQTFSSRQPSDAMTDKLASEKKRRGLLPSEPLHPRPRSAIKPLVGTKRSHRSDTESSADLSPQATEDEGAARPRVQKEEEEEETESADNHDDLPPPAPVKPLRSRKRRRTEDVNSNRGVKASTSTRSKRSETPAIATRSGKRLRSGVSSTRGLTAEPATRVFALWKQDGHYYSGVVHSRGLKNRYLIVFDDTTEDDVELKNMRREELLVGDSVIVVLDSAKGVVVDVSRVHSHDSFTLEIDDGEAVTTREVKTRDVRIASRTIQSRWKERTLTAENICPLIKQSSIDSTPSRQSIASMTSGKAQRELVRTGFVVTMSPKNEHAGQTKDEAMRAIKQHGGVAIEDWSSVFTMEGKHSQGNKRWVAIPQDFRWRSETKLDRVFLLSDDAHQKPKFLLALALGIPCISFEWLTKGKRISLDWQPYLLPAGYSDSLCARVSQLVDLDWGNCAEHLTDIMGSRVPIKLFLQKTVLCVGAELVPLPLSRAKKNTGEEASRYVPWIILCMGAAKVEAVTDTRQVSAQHMRSFDYIVVKERSILGPVQLGSNVVVGDITWVKQCLVSSRLSTPEFD